MRHFWSDEECRVLREMVEAGCEPNEIALVLTGRNAESIRQQAARRGFKFYNPAAINEAEFHRIMAERRGKAWKPQA